MSVIYKITNTITQDEYIGKTVKSPNIRFSIHKSISKKGQTYLYRAMRKYGIDNFILSIIEECSPEILDEREKFWIKSLSPRYNMTEGGTGGNTSNSPNYKKGIELYHQNRSSEQYATYGMLGKKHSKKTKDKIGKKNSYPVMCMGIKYPSIKEAQEAHPGISIRKRLASEKYPEFYRLRPKRLFR